MTLTFYNVTADTRCLDKISQLQPTYTTPASPSLLKPDTDVDIINPEFDLTYNSIILTSNYVYCDTFGRYYYITNMAVNTAQRIIVSCSVDVLQTYASDIKNSTATILRSESIGAPTHYTDSKLPVYPAKNNVTSIIMECQNSDLNDITIPPALAHCYVLTVVAGTPNA